jgi:hypothetical protein
MFEMMIEGGNIMSEELSYYQLHKESFKVYQKKYRDIHKDELKVKQKMYDDSRKDSRKSYYKKYDSSHKIQRKTKDARINSSKRMLGFSPLNSPFIGSHIHHLHEEYNLSFCVYIPSFLHAMVPHCSKTGAGMQTINAVALSYWLIDYQFFKDD